MTVKELRKQLKNFPGFINVEIVHSNRTWSCDTVIDNRYRGTDIGTVILQSNERPRNPKP